MCVCVLREREGEVMMVRVMFVLPVGGGIGYLQSNSLDIFFAVHDSLLYEALLLYVCVCVCVCVCVSV